MISSPVHLYTVGKPLDLVNAAEGLLHTRTCLEGRKRGQVCLLCCKVTQVRLSGIEPGNVNWGF